MAVADVVAFYDGFAQDDELAYGGRWDEAVRGPDDQCDRDCSRLRPRYVARRRAQQQVMTARAAVR